MMFIARDKLYGSICYAELPDRRWAITTPEDWHMMKGCSYNELKPYLYSVGLEDYNMYLPGEFLWQT